MNSGWMKWFTSVAEESDSVAFPDYPTQSIAVRDASVVSRLTDFRLIQVSGEDAQAFLQGQLSSDVRELDGTRAQYSSYSTAKGRMLASFLIWRVESDYFLLVSADIAEAMVKRLSMFIMRSRVKAVLCADTLLLGFNGPEAESWINSHLSCPVERMALSSAAGGACCIRMASGALLLTLNRSEAASWASGAANHLVPVSPEAWSLIDIAAGIPWISLATQEQFVPQMTNMDAIGAVSFTKGCYPGQEIIARTRYLGKIKRRMERVLLPCAANNGAVLYSPVLGEQTIGMLVNVARDAEGHYTALAVAQSACWTEGVYLDKQNIKKIEKLFLPYTVSDE